MTSASEAVQVATISAADSLTSLPVRGGVSTVLPHWRIETPLEPESGRNKEGSATVVTIFATVFSKDLAEVYSEMTTMANGLAGTISPAGFRVLGLETGIRQIAGSEEPDEEVYARQLEIELTVEPTS